MNNFLILTKVYNVFFERLIDRRRQIRESYLFACFSIRYCILYIYISFEFRYCVSRMFYTWFESGFEFEPISNLLQIYYDSNLGN